MRLWNLFTGKGGVKEPWLINPVKKGSSTMKRRKAGRIKSAIRKSAKRRSSRVKRFVRRHNPLALVNKPKLAKQFRSMKRVRPVMYKSKSGMSISPLSRRYGFMRGRRVNRPMAVLGKVLPVNITSKAFIQEVSGLAIGFVGATLVPSYVLPVEWRGTDWRGYVGKVGSVLALSFVIGNVMKRKEMGKAIFMGGMVAVAVDLVTTYVLPAIRPAASATTQGIRGLSSGTGAIIPRSEMSGLGQPISASSDSRW